MAKKPTTTKSRSRRKTTFPDLQQLIDKSQDLVTVTEHVPVAKATPVATTIDVSSVRLPVAKRHWFLGFVCLSIGLALAFVGIAINSRYNASTGQNTEYAYWMGLLGLGSDLACISLPSIYKALISIGENKQARLLLLVCVVATATTLYTTESFLALNIGDAARQRDIQTQTANDARQQHNDLIANLQANVSAECKFGDKHPSPQCVKDRASLAEAIKAPMPSIAAVANTSDPGAHNVADTLSWFGLSVQERTIQIIRTFLFALLPVCAGLILSACVPLFSRRQVA